MEILEILKQAVEAGASDVHITVASPPIMRVNGKLLRMTETKLLPDDTERIIMEMLTETQTTDFNKRGELDFSYSWASLGRFRVNIYRQRGTCSMALRVVALSVPSMETLKLPSILKDLAMKQR